jgi:alkaline phosphatase D
MTSNTDMKESYRSADRITRRRFLTTSTATVGGALAFGRAPGIVTAQAARPAIAQGVQSGDITLGRGIVWSRTDRPARLVVRYGTTPKLTGARTRTSAPASAMADFTARIDLSDLPAGQRIFYEARFEDAAGVFSEPVTGSFATPATSARPVTVAWGGDVAGQGWGIDVDRGGMRIYESMRAHQPDLFVHSGDMIYADGPILAEVKLADGTFWKNIVTEEVSKPAETLREFRGRFLYNLLDEQVRRFNAEVPMIAQWDDHEVLNNWYPGEILGDTGPAAAYKEKRVDTLVPFASQAFHEYVPLRANGAEPRRVYRSYAYGPLLDVFVLDCRTYRGPNTANRQPQPGADMAMLGAAQLGWLKQALSRSRAAWKLIACDMPLGVVVPDGRVEQEGFANNAPEALGRELELVDLLRFLRAQRIRNYAFITADVHYCAAHEYHPTRAVFTEFDPFWEFVAGPLHAGTFAPGALDKTFGPEMKFCGWPAGATPNQPPGAGLQFFGLFRVDPKTRAATVTLNNREGKEIYRVELPPA